MTANAKQTKLFDQDIDHSDAKKHIHGRFACEFCAVIANEVDNCAVFRDDISLAFLDKRPLFPGHCLLIPLQHFETFTDLPSALVGPLFINAQLIARSVVCALNADGSFIAMNNRVSQSVPHLHVHIVPRRKKDGLKGFFWPRQRYESLEAMKRMQNTLKEAIARCQKGGQQLHS